MVSQRFVFSALGLRILGSGAVAFGAGYFSFRPEPIVELVVILAAARFVELVRATANVVVDWDSTNKPPDSNGRPINRDEASSAPARFHPASEIT